MILEVLEFGFMQRALIAGVSVAITSSVIGLFLVLRHNSLFGDALSHAAFGGIAVGLATNIYPLWTGLTLSILAMTGTILSIIILLYRQLMYITFDEEQARVSGLPISKLNYLFIILASVAVIVSMRLVGILLVSSLLVIPNVTALLFNKGFKKTALISVSISIFSVVTGIAISYAANLAPAGTIVLVSTAVFLTVLAARYYSKRKQIVKKLEEARS